MDKVLYPSTPILIVDDEEEFLSSICFLLKTEGITNLVQCKDSREVLSYLSQQKFSIILLDLGMPYISGWDLLPILIRDFPEIPVVIVTAEDGIENTVGCIKAGACDYIVKPIDENRFLMIIRNIIKLNEVQDENKLLRKHLVSDKIEHPEVFSEIVTKNDTMKSIFRYIEAIAGTSLPILITGET
ncbi:MAG: response regulator, partial [Spirochaetes bacterium]|nr:response regulator [Spirochaetota bacterium]